MNNSLPYIQAGTFKDNPTKKVYYRLGPHGHGQPHSRIQWSCDVTGTMLDGPMGKKIERIEPAPSIQTFLPPEYNYFRKTKQQKALDQALKSYYRYQFGLEDPVVDDNSSTHIQENVSRPSKVKSPVHQSSISSLFPPSRGSIGKELPPRITTEQYKWERVNPPSNVQSPPPVKSHRDKRTAPASVVRHSSTHKDHNKVRKPKRTARLPEPSALYMACRYGLKLAPDALQFPLERPLSSLSSRIPRKLLNTRGKGVDYLESCELDSDGNWVDNPIRYRSPSYWKRSF